jgi:hypothetical protein
MTRPAALGAARAELKVKRKRKNTVPQCRKQNSGRFVKQKKKTTQHSGGVAPRYRLASGLAFMAKAPSLVFLCRIGTILVGQVLER